MDEKNNYLVSAVDSGRVFVTDMSNSPALYAVDDNMQRKRILFPLPFYNMNKPLKVEEKDWRHDSLFVSQAYYTLLYETAKGVCK